MKRAKGVNGNVFPELLWTVGVSPAEVGTAVVANPVKRNGVATGYHTPSTPELKPLADAHIEVVPACHAMSSPQRQPTRSWIRPHGMSSWSNTMVLGRARVPQSKRTLHASKEG